MYLDTFPINFITIISLPCYEWQNQKNVLFNVTFKKIKSLVNTVCSKQSDLQVRVVFSHSQHHWYSQGADEELHFPEFSVPSQQFPAAVLPISFPASAFCQLVTEGRCPPFWHLKAATKKKNASIFFINNDYHSYQYTTSERERMINLY